MFGEEPLNLGTNSRVGKLFSQECGALCAILIQGSFKQPLYCLPVIRRCRHDLLSILHGAKLSPYSNPLPVSSFSVGPGFYSILRHPERAVRASRGSNTPLPL